MALNLLELTSGRINVKFLILRENCMLLFFTLSDKQPNDYYLLVTHVYDKVTFCSSVIYSLKYIKNTTVVGRKK